jgi:hypothetical protein
MTTWSLSLPLPAQWTALHEPVDVSLIPFQADFLVGIGIEQGRKGVGASFELSLERQQAESQIGQAQFGTKLAQTILETGTANAQSQTTASSRSVGAFKTSLQVTDMYQGEFWILIVRLINKRIVRMICELKRVVSPGLAKGFFQRQLYNLPHAVCRNTVRRV